MQDICQAKTGYPVQGWGSLTKSSLEKGANVCEHTFYSLIHSIYDAPMWLSKLCLHDVISVSEVNLNEHRHIKIYSNYNLAFLCKALQKSRNYLLE